MKRYFRDFLHDFKNRTSYELIDVDNIISNILAAIPRICSVSNKITTGIFEELSNKFSKVERLINQLQSTASCVIISDYENFVSLDDILEKLKNIFNILTEWLSVNDHTILIIIINSIPKLINALNIIGELATNNKNKRLKLEKSDLLFFMKTLIKRTVQIFSLLSVSTNVKVRLSCVYNTSLLARTDGFDLNIIENAFSSPISPINYLKSTHNTTTLMYGDTTDAKSFSHCISKFRQTNNNLSFISAFSTLNIRKIHSITGKDNEIYDMGWLSRRLDDESPAVRFEIFMMIYELLINEKLYQHDSLLKMIHEIVFDCFLDDNIAIQSLISEIIIMISKRTPIETSSLFKVLPSLNDSNTNTRYNILKIISSSIFDNSETLYKALTALLDSPLLHFDEKLLYNIFSLIGINHPNLAHIIVPVLFKQYYHKEEEFYHASISILFFWSLWKMPSIITKFNLDLILLYSLVKLNFSSYIPYLRIRLSNQRIDSECYEIKPQLYNLNIINYAFGIYPEKSELKVRGSHYLIKDSLFVSIGNYPSFENANNRTLMSTLLNGISPLEYILNFSINHFTSYESFEANKKSIFNLLKLFNFCFKLNYNNYSRLNTSSNIKLLLKILGLNINKNLLFSENSQLIDIFNLGLMNHRGSNFIHNSLIWPRYSKFNRELSIILESEMFLSSSFIVSAPISCGSISFSYFYENYKPLIKNSSNRVKYCLLSGNLTQYFSEFKNLFCKCILCKYRTYIEDYNLEYLDDYSKVIYSQARKTLEKKKKPIKYQFPYKVPQKIPINISFNINGIKNFSNNKTLGDSNILIFVQLPQILHFVPPKMPKYKSYKNLREIKYSNNILREIESMNFEPRNHSNIYSKINRKYSFKLETKENDAPTKIFVNQIKINNRQTYVFFIGKDTLRISYTHLIPIKYECPTATPIFINVALINQISENIRPISNTYLTIIHPNIMA